MYLTSKQAEKIEKQKLKRVFFRSWDLSEKAYKTYTQISFIFYQDTKGGYYVAECPQSEPIHIGDINDLESYLLSYLDD